MPDSPTLTVRAVIALYLSHLKSRCLAGDFSDQTYEGIERELNLFGDRHGTKSVAECRKHDMTEWIASHPQWRSAWTRKRVLETIVRPFAWAEDEELIEASPYRRPKKMRRGKQRRPATEHEYITLMRFASRELRRALFFMRRSGARTKEMREVEFAEIAFDRGVIILDDHKTIRQQQAPMPRIIGLDAATLRFLANLYRRRRPGQVLVFVNCDGTPWDRHTFARHMNRWATRLGLDPTRAKLSPYCFRHTYGTNAIIAGVGERQLADQMGHTTTKMVAYYAQTAGKIEHLRRVATDALKRPKKRA